MGGNRSPLCLRAPAWGSGAAWGSERARAALRKAWLLPWHMGKARPVFIGPLLPSPLTVVVVQKHTNNCVLYLAIRFLDYSSRA